MLLCGKTAKAAGLTPEAEGIELGNNINGPNEWEPSSKANVTSWMYSYKR